MIERQDDPSSVVDANRPQGGRQLCLAIRRPEPPARGSVLLALFLGERSPALVGALSCDPSGDEVLDYLGDDGLFVLGEVDRRLEGHPEAVLDKSARVVREQQPVRAHRQRHAQAPDHIEGRLCLSDLVAVQLARVHPDPLGQPGLGEAAFTTDPRQFVTELHVESLPPS